MVDLWPATVMAVVAVFFMILFIYNDQADGVLRVVYPPPTFRRADVNFTNSKNQVVIVTGGNVGLGYTSAKFLAEAGSVVIVACRSKAKGEAAAERITKSARAHGHGGRAEYMSLDLADHRSIKAFASAFEKQYNRLNVLMLNAGVMATEFDETVDGFEVQVGINFIGHYYLTELLLPLLVGSAPSRVVSLTSKGHLIWSEPDMIMDEFRADHPANTDRHTLLWKWKFYGRSKLLNIIHMKILTERLLEQGINNVYCNSVHPGTVATELGHNFFGSWANLASKFLFAMPPEYGALSQLFAAVSPEVEKLGLRGVYLVPLVRVVDPSPLALNKTLAKAVYEYSERVVAAWEKPTSF